MIALCRKELRENLRWALLAMITFGLAEWYALYHEQENGSIGYYFGGKGLGLCHTTFLSVTTFGCPVVGLLLGFLQILPELRRDRWASLLHRPVSRGVVFRGKVAGGLILYALATVPPFLFSIWLVATPGHFAFPFVGGTVLAGAADICAGAVYYFAALGMSLQRDRWIGARFFPLLAALHLSYAVLSAHLFRVAVEAAVVMSLALFTAGWGMMLHQEKLAERPWLARIAFVAVMFYGACGLGDLGQSIFSVIGPSPRSHYVEYQLSEVGVPLRIAYENNVVTAVTDFAGRPLSDPKYQPGQVRNHLKYLNRFSSFIGDPHGWRPRRARYDYRDIYRYLTLVSPYFRPRPEQWFYPIRQRSWVGYVPVGKTVIGRLDGSGFEPPSATPEPFGSRWKYDQFGDELILYTNTRVRLASLPRREIAEVALPAPGPIYGVGTAWTVAGDGSVTVFGVTQDKALTVYQETGARVATLPYHQDVSRWGTLSLGLNSTKDRFYLEYEPSAWFDEVTRTKMPLFFEEMDARGQVLQTYTMPPEPAYQRAVSWGDYIASRIQSPAFFFGSMGYQKIGGLLGSKRLEADLHRRFGRDWLRTRELTLAIVLLSLILAAVTLSWTLRVGFSRQQILLWVGFVLFFGLAGFFAFCLTADWPQLVPCPHCRKSRAVEGEVCPHCGTAWPAIVSEGTEIFDRRSMPVVAAVPL